MSAGSADVLQCTRDKKYFLTKFQDPSYDICPFQTLLGTKIPIQSQRIFLTKLTNLGTPKFVTISFLFPFASDVNGLKFTPSARWQRQKDIFHPPEKNT